MDTRAKKTLIACYSLDGKLIKTYPNCQKAASSIHVFSRTIDKAVREKRIIHEKQWRRVLFDDVPSFIERYEKKNSVLSIRPIAEIDENNRVIQTYRSIKYASKMNEVDPHTIRDVLDGKTKKAKGKRYRYLSASEIKEYGYTVGQSHPLKTTPVIQYSLDGKYIKTYPSISAAATALGRKKTNQGINQCLKGKYSTAFGYAWKYKKF